MTRLRAAAILLAAACSRDLGLPASSPPFAVAPPVAQVAPLGSADFTLSGGQRPWALQLLAQSSEEAPGAAALASLDFDRIHYTAGTRGSVQDTLQLTDAAGHALTVTISIGQEVQISPPVASVASLGTATFRASGGHPDYHFEVVERLDESGVGAVFTYRAPVGPTEETLRVTDANGAVTLAPITVGLRLEVLPRGVSVAPGGSVQFQALGGAPPYTFAALNDSCDGAEPSGVQLNAQSGAFQVNREAVGDLDVCVQVTDTAGGSAESLVHVLPGLKPPEVGGALDPGTAIDLVATDGTPPYQFRIAPAGNSTGGSVTPGGHYLAGPNAFETDRLTVTDTLGVVQPFQITTGPLRLPASAEPVAAAQFPFFAGHLYLPGLHVSLGGDGLLHYLPFPSGTLCDVGDFNNDGLPDAIVSVYGALQLFTATPGGDVAWTGGAVLGRCAVVVQSPDHALALALVLHFQATPSSAVCGLAAMSLATFAAGDPSGAACLSAAEPDSLARLGPGSFVALGPDALRFWSWDGSSAPAVDSTQPLPAAQCDSCPLRQSISPAVVDLDSDGQPDVAFYFMESGNGAPVFTLAAALAAGSAPVSMPLLTGVSFLFPGPTASGLNSVIVTDGAHNSIFEVQDGAWQQDFDLQLDADAHFYDSFVYGAGDIDGDGNFDWLGQLPGDALELHLGNGSTGQRTDAGHRFRLQTTGTVAALWVGDFNADGRDDVLVDATETRSLMVGLDHELAYENFPPFNGTLLAKGRFTGGPFLDLLAVNTDREFVVVPYTCGAAAAPCPVGGFGAPRDLSLGQGDQCDNLQNFQTAAGDLVLAEDTHDDQGACGGAVLSIAGISFSLEEGSLSAQSHVAFDVPSNFGGDSISLLGPPADFDGDGVPDVLVVDSDAAELVLLLGSSGGDLYSLSVGPTLGSSDGVSDVLIDPLLHRVFAAHELDGTGHVQVDVYDGRGGAKTTQVLLPLAHPASTVNVALADVDGVPGGELLFSYQTAQGAAIGVSRIAADLSVAAPVLTLGPLSTFAVARLSAAGGDLAVSLHSNRGGDGALQVWSNQGDLTFAPTPPLP